MSVTPRVGDRRLTVGDIIAFALMFAVVLAGMFFVSVKDWEEPPAAAPVHGPKHQPVCRGGTL